MKQIVPIVLFLCGLTACGEEASMPNDVAPSSQLKLTRAAEVSCDSAINVGIDCHCIGQVIDGVLSKSAIAELFAPDQEDALVVSQQSIDDLIEVALVAEDVCLGG